MKKILFFIWITTVLLSCNSNTSNQKQLVSNDPAIKSNSYGFDSGYGANDLVAETAIQSDGKILIGGDFTSYNGIAISCIARLNTDGSLDSSFNAGADINDAVYTIAIQSNGKIIIGGSFTSDDEMGINRIARLNADGSLDESFNPGMGPNNHVGGITLQSDGRIIIYGDFTSYNGVSIGHIARLNTDGSLDASFNTGAGADDFIYTTVLQSDGKIIIGGYFLSYNGIERNGIARLNTDGSLDASFNPKIGVDNMVFAIAIQSDGRIIVGSYVPGNDEKSRNKLLRLNVNGSLDDSFKTGTGLNRHLEIITIQSNGKIIIGGWFTSYNGTDRNHIARLNPNGSLDTSFNPGAGAEDYVYATSIQNDGKIIIGGSFTSFDGELRNHIARLNADGSLELH